MTAKDLADYLRRCAFGADSAMRSRDVVLSWHSEVSGREIRKLAAEAAEHGFPVIGGPRGYFYARSRKEAAAAIARLESHAKAELRHASVLKKILEDPGQGHLWESDEAAKAPAAGEAGR